MSRLSYVTHSLVTLLTLCFFSTKAFANCKIVLIGENSGNNLLQLSYDKQAQLFAHYSFQLAHVGNVLLKGKGHEVAKAVTRLLDKDLLSIVSKNGFFHTFNTHQSDPSNPIDTEINTVTFGFAYSENALNIHHLFPSIEGKYLGIIGVRKGIQIINKNGQRQEALYTHGLKYGEFLPHQLFTFSNSSLRFYDLENLSDFVEVKGDKAILTAAAKPFDANHIVVVEDDNKYVLQNQKDKILLGKRLSKSLNPLVSYSTHGSFFVIVDGENIEIFNSIDLSLNSTFKISGVILNLAWSTDERYLAVHTYNGLYVYDAYEKNWNLLSTLQQKNIYSISWSEKDNYIITLSEDNHRQEYWSIDFVDPRSGYSLDGIEVKKDNNFLQPPHIVGQQGSIFEGTFKAYIISNNGELFFWQQLFNFTAQ
ncbi:MAG: hypothetical protein KDD40_06815 [Bdellovibrionales bacterium]|nr:hypothetical protein [Bdellovibrionales bacterium]